MGLHEHFGQNDLTIAAAADYDATVAPVAGTGILWVPAAGKFAPRQVLTPADLNTIGDLAGRWAGSAAVRTNLSSNPNGGTSNAGYSAKVDSGQAITAAPVVGTGGANGSTSCLVATIAAGGTGEVNLPRATVGLVAGQLYTFSCYVQAPTGKDVAIAVNWFAAGGGYVATTTSPAAAPGAARATSDGGYVRVAITAVCPAGANGGQAGPYVSAYALVAGGTVSYSQNLDERAAGAGAYFDGSFPGATWGGTANLSTSTLTLGAASLGTAATVSATAATATALGGTATTYTAPTGVIGTAFVAPPSGRVVLEVASAVSTTTTAATAYVSPQVATGATVAAGTVFLAAADANAIVATSTAYASGARNTLVTGLTAGATYNVALLYRSSVNTATAAMVWPRVIVVPVPS